MTASPRDYLALKMSRLSQSSTLLQDWFTSFGGFSLPPLSPEVLEPAGVYAGGMMGGVQIVEGPRGECCKEPVLDDDCIKKALNEGERPQGLCR